MTLWVVSRQSVDCEQWELIGVFTSSEIADSECIDSTYRQDLRDRKVTHD